MESIGLWPNNPLASFGLIWFVSVVFLWAARRSMLKLLATLGGGIADGLESLGKLTRSSSDDLAERSRKVLLAAGTRDAQGRLDRELERIDAGFSDQLGQYAGLQRRLDEQLLALDADYRNSGIVAPEVPGWTSAVESISGIPVTGDPNVQRVLESIKDSSRAAEKKVLAAYRDDSAKRHKLLGKMIPCWKEIRGLVSRMSDAVAQALESTSNINAFIEDYANLREEREESARALTFSAWKYFIVSALVLGIALGGAFINFQLIALPMSELVPAGARVGGVPVSTVSALVIVLMEAALGIFLMDMLGITEFFPKLATVPSSRRRMILWLAFAGLLFLSGVESSLAVLREQIVEADAALKLSLAGGQEVRVVQSASQSSIPVIGQAVLGFVLPWVLALVAVPLEMLLDSSRHVFAALTIALLRGVGSLLRGLAHVARQLTDILSSLYDVYIAIPLRIEEMMMRARRDDVVTPMGGGPKAPGATEKSLA